MVIFRHTVASGLCVLTATNDDELPDKFRSAIAFVPRAIEIALYQLNYVIQAEAREVENIRRTGGMLTFIQTIV